jgi:hypothetical protein
MKFLAILFSIIVMTLTIVPCCAYDHCDDEQTQEAKSGKQEIPCSPFVSCPCSPSAVCMPPSLVFDCFPLTLIEKNETRIHPSFISIYCANIWQPPKITC